MAAFISFPRKMNSIDIDLVTNQPKFELIKFGFPTSLIVTHPLPIFGGIGKVNYKF